MVGIREYASPHVPLHHADKGGGDPYIGCFVAAGRIVARPGAAAAPFPGPAPIVNREISCCRLSVSRWRSSAARAICCVPCAVSPVTFEIASTLCAISSLVDDCSSLAAAICATISVTF